MALIGMKRALLASNFSLARFMAAQSDGLYYDFTKTDRLFTTDTGPTNVATVGDTIGLALDQRTWGGQALAQVVVGQSELVTNGTFDTNTTGWVQHQTAGTGSISASAGRLVVSNNGSGQYTRAEQTLNGLVVGQTYCLSYNFYLGLFSGIVSVSTIPNELSTFIYKNILSSDTQTKTYFVATATTLYLAAWLNSGDGTAIGYFDNLSLKLVPGHAATQASATLRGTYQTAGDKFDGADDYLLTDYVAGSGANFLIMRATIAATLAATQVLGGASGAAANRFFLGVNTSGNVCGGVGSDSVTTIVGTTDVRNTEIVAGIACDGSNVRLFVNNAIEYSAVQNSTPTTTIPFMFGSVNSNGTAASPANVYEKRVVAGRSFPSLSQYQQIRNALLAP